MYFKRGISVEPQNEAITCNDTLHYMYILMMVVKFLP